MTVFDQTYSRRRFLEVSGAVGATVALGGVLQACTPGGGAASPTTGTINWMTWGDHWIQSQLDEIASAANITHEHLRAGRERGGLRQGQGGQGTARQDLGRRHVGP